MWHVCLTGEAVTGENVWETGLAEKCLASFMHPLPATLLSEALDVAKEVGPPVCQKSYMGSTCKPVPDPVAHGGSCPQGFMCMPDPSKCTSW